MKTSKCARASQSRDPQRETDIATPPDTMHAPSLLRNPAPRQASACAGRGVRIFGGAPSWAAYRELRHWQNLQCEPPQPYGRLSLGAEEATLSSAGCPSHDLTKLKLATRFTIPHISSSSIVFSTAVFRSSSFCCSRGQEPHERVSPPALASLG